MGIRVLDFSDGFESASAPTEETFSKVTGTYASPVAVTAASGIVNGGYSSEIQYVVGSPGAVNISANPQIDDGTIDGQVLELIGTHATNTVTLENGNGLVTNGDCILTDGSIIRFVWSDNAGLWFEEYRNDV